jgi:hypothetical protein
VDKKSWVIKRNKRKCAVCKYEWSPQKLPLQISRSDWKHLIRYFLEFETVNSIVKKMNLGRGQVLRAYGIISDNPIASLNGVYGLVYHNERVYGRLLSGQTGQDLEKIMNESAGKIITWSPVLDRYTGVITKTRLYYLNHEGKSVFGSPHLVCYSIWVGLKILIAAKHGIRREWLPVYIGEVIWRSNFDKLSTISQRRRIFSLIQAGKYKIEGKSLNPRQ